MTDEIRRRKADRKQVREVIRAELLRFHRSFAEVCKVLGSELRELEGIVESLTRFFLAAAQCVWKVRAKRRTLHRKILCLCSPVSLSGKRAVPLHAEILVGPCVGVELLDPR